ncbi:hypothetical protein [Micromonospora aurantiaca (nom. illeg.)]|uniref:hypothetical protein n=1 Tax=Micromonospora aurantiaca (nom. illeg.) TaxID=47850 RepID=UPI0033DB5407
MSEYPIVTVWTDETLSPLTPRPEPAPVIVQVDERTVWRRGGTNTDNPSQPEPGDGVLDAIAEHDARLAEMSAEAELTCDYSAYDTARADYNEQAGGLLVGLTAAVRAERDAAARLAADEPVIRIVFSAADVDALADDSNIPRELARQRIREWAKHIGNTATALVNEQMRDAIKHGTP